MVKLLKLVKLCKLLKSHILLELHIGHQQKVRIWHLSRYGGFLTGFYKGTFRAQTGRIVHSRNFLVLFRP